MLKYYLKIRKIFVKQKHKAKAIKENIDVFEYIEVFKKLKLKTKVLKQEHTGKYSK